jgi:hypothetical protein
MDIMIRRIVESDVDSIAKSLHIGINSASNTSATGGKTKKASGSLWWLCQVNKWSVTPMSSGNRSMSHFEKRHPRSQRHECHSRISEARHWHGIDTRSERTAIEHGKNIMGIGFGLTADYGAAQRLYPKLGYIPDGRGAQPTPWGDVLFLTKRLL